MRKATGDLGLISLQELMAGAEDREKTGELRIGRGEVKKTFFLQEGKVIFVTSNRTGERFGEFLAATGCLNMERMKQILEESRARGVPFTGDLLALGVFERRELESALCQLVIRALAEALTWREGSFEFTDLLPSRILKGPVRIAVTNALGQALRLNHARRTGALADDPWSSFRLRESVDGGEAGRA